ncbi:MAG: esterase/lipase family protein [Acidimicrobiia bacterium]
MDQELQDIGDACELVTERIVEPVQGMHRVISDRVFRYVGPPGAPVRAVHDPLVEHVYRIIPRLARAAGTGAASAVASRNPELEPVSRSRRGSGWQAAINGLWGDRLARRGNSLAVPLSVRTGPGALDLEPSSLTAAYPAAGRHVVILLHGLGQTERCWHRGVDGGVQGALAAIPGLTPLPVRYNTGLPIGQAGDDLAEMLALIHRNWPVEDPSISLVGYSMGGLMARRAWATASAAGQAWAMRTRHLITIGSPHTGSPLARAAQVGAVALGLTRTSRPLGDFISGQSPGMKNLRDGAGVAEAWGGAIAAQSTTATLPLREHVIAAVVTGDRSHPFGVIAGDLVVRVGSATAGSEAAENVRVIGQRRHFDLLTDRQIIEQLVAWLADEAAGD